MSSLENKINLMLRQQALLLKAIQATQYRNYQVKMEKIVKMWREALNEFLETKNNSFAEQYGHLTVGDAIKLNKKERSKMRKVDWKKTIICGVSLGFMASTLYLLLVIAAQITA